MGDPDVKTEICAVADVIREWLNRYIGSGDGPPSGRVHAARRAQRREGAPAPPRRDAARCGQSALPLSKRSIEAFESVLGPELAGLVVIPERRRSLRQLEPLGLRARVDVHVRLQRARVVERADAHEADVGSMSVVAPDGGLTFGTTIDVVRTILARHGHGHRLAAEQFDRPGLDDRIEYKRAARQPLAIIAMAAVDEHWFFDELVADGPAAAAAAEFLGHGDLITQTLKH